ncbi:MAG TPA: DUF2849 domain-containing protein [Stellaceae bacterium]|nr:DUF2849 domain-containing protein [Stellaceae bacterium]
MSDEARLVTANRLRDGVPVYFGPGRTWSRSIADAVVAGAGESESLLAAASAGPAPLPVVAPYLIEAAVASGRPVPLSLRERIRAFGPTV